MTYLAVLEMLLKYGPSAVQIGAKLIAAIKAGKGNTTVTDGDWAELDRLSTLSASDIYAKLHIDLPVVPASKNALS